MKLSINDPNRAKQRQVVEHLSIYEEKQIIETFKEFFLAAQFLDSEAGKELSEQFSIRIENLLQRLIDNYENLKHFYTVVGGWDGYERLLGVSNITATADIKVEYELVKGGDDEYVRGNRKHTPKPQLL